MMKKNKSILYTRKDVHYDKKAGFNFSYPEATDFKGTKENVAEAYMVGFLQKDGKVYLLKYREGAAGRLVSRRDFWKMAECATKGITFGTKPDMLADCN